MLNLERNEGHKTKREMWEGNGRRGKGIRVYRKGDYHQITLYACVKRLSWIPCFCMINMCQLHTHTHYTQKKQVIFTWSTTHNGLGTLDGFHMVDLLGGLSLDYSSDLKYTVVQFPWSPPGGEGKALWLMCWDSSFIWITCISHCSLCLLPQH